MAYATNSSPILGYLAHIGRQAIPELQGDLAAVYLKVVLVLALWSFC